MKVVIAICCAIFLLFTTGSKFAEAQAGEDGIVRLKSEYSFSETIYRLKKDIGKKGIRFFSEIDQSRLASGAGVKLGPSTLLVFGNPALGTLF